MQAQSQAQQAAASLPAVPDWEMAAGGKMEFEVASIHLANPGSLRGLTLLWIKSMPTRSQIRLADSPPIFRWLFA
jgi:hypothetical protein